MLPPDKAAIPDPPIQQNRQVLIHDLGNVRLQKLAVRDGWLPDEFGQKTV